VKFHFECPANGALALTVPTQFT